MDTQSVKAPIQQSGQGSCLETGIALPTTAELTTMPAGQAATNAVHTKTLMPPGAKAALTMDQKSLFLLDGSPAIGFALGEFTLYSRFMFK